jgi:hypothetical protein
MAGFLVALLAALGMSASAQADQVPFPEIYDGPLLLLTRASEADDSLPENLVKQISPKTVAVLSARGFHALLDDKRSACFKEGCTAVFVAEMGAERRVSAPIDVDADTTIGFFKSADDTDECYRGRAFFEGIDVVVREWPIYVRAEIGTAVACEGENADLSNYDRDRTPYVWMRSEKAENRPPSDSSDFRYQVGQQTFVVDRSEILRRVLREEDAE